MMPDFKQIAQRITEAASVDAFDTITDRRVTTLVVEVLRQVWNARGEADIELLLEILDRPIGILATPDNVRATFGRLDR
jgi:hypothetical protein